MPSPKPKIRRRKAKKRKGKVTIKERVKVRSKATKRADRDSLPNAPTRKTLPDNSVTFKIKIKRK